MADAAKPSPRPTASPVEVANLAESLLRHAQQLYAATQGSTRSAYHGGAYSPEFVAVLANGTARAALDVAVLAATVDGMMVVA